MSGPPTSSHLEALASRYSLSADAVAALDTLVDLLVDDPMAPTGVRDTAGVIDDHIADSLVALELAEVRRAGDIADLGAGAGLPGLVLAAARPDARVSLVESSGRKCAFIARAIERCDLANAQVVNERAEAWTEGRDQHDLVTARALSAPAVVAEYAAPLLRIGGILLLWRGMRDPEAERMAAAAADELGLELGRVVHVSPYEGATNRHLHLMSKVRGTPSRFPRRPGAAAKRPLGR
jgi:16S rRNA (guanine527-N7)-methyltransferase